MTVGLFLGFVLATAASLLALMRRALPFRAWVGLCAGLVLWLAYVGALGWSGVLRVPALRPPGPVYLFGPVVLFVLLVVVLSPAAGRIARAIPLAWLIGFQAFRVGVELFLHQLHAEGLVPRMLTFEGANVDIWIGASAPIVAWLATRGRSGDLIALVWNVLGLLALANVVVRSALTAPGPLHVLTSDVPNQAIGTFPYTYVAGFLAPLAVTLHVLALRARAARPKTSALSKGLAA